MHGHVTQTAFFPAPGQPAARAALLASLPSLTLVNPQLAIKFSSLSSRTSPVKGGVCVSELVLRRWMHQLTPPLQQQQPQWTATAALESAASVHDALSARRAAGAAPTKSIKVKRLSVG